MSNRFGIPDAEYEQMQREAYEYFNETEEPLTQDDEVRMYLDYAARHLVYRNRQEPIPADDWAMIADAYVDMKNHPELVSDEIKQCFDAFAVDHGCYWLKEPEKWAEVRYCLAKGQGFERFADSDWYVYDGVWSAAPLPDMDRNIITVKTMSTVMLTPVLCKLDVCIERRRPWSEEIRDDVKHSIIANLNCISADCQDVIDEYESIDAVIEGIEALREKRGLNGNEPYLPYYRQKELGFGASVEQIRADAKDKYDEALEERDESLREVYEAVMAYKNRNLDLLPDYVKCDLTYDDFDIEADRLLLGFDLEHLYGDEYADRFGVYEMKNTVENGVDFSKDAVGEASSYDIQFRKMYESVYEPFKRTASDEYLCEAIEYAIDISHVGEKASVRADTKPIGQMTLFEKDILLAGSIACDVLIERYGEKACESKFPTILAFDNCVLRVYEADSDAIMYSYTPPDFQVNSMSATLVNEYIHALEDEERILGGPLIEQVLGQNRFEKAQARLCVTAENDGKDIGLGD